MLVECIPKEPLSFQIIPFDNPRLQFSIHVRIYYVLKYERLTECFGSTILKRDIFLLKIMIIAPL